MFRRIAPPGEAELQAVVERPAERIGRALERRGVLVRDAESSFLAHRRARGGEDAPTVLAAGTSAAAGVVVLIPWIVAVVRAF